MSKVEEDKKETKVIHMDEPKLYEIDFSKAESFEELKLILAQIGAAVFMYQNDYEKSPIKKFLKEHKNGSTIKESNS